MPARRSGGYVLAFPASVTENSATLSFVMTSTPVSITFSGGIAARRVALGGEPGIHLLDRYPNWNGFDHGGVDGAVGNALQRACLLVEDSGQDLVLLAERLERGGGNTSAKREDQRPATRSDREGR